MTRTITALIICLASVGCGALQPPNPAFTNAYSECMQGLEATENRAVGQADAVFPRGMQKSDYCFRTARAFMQNTPPFMAADAESATR